MDAAFHPIDSAIVYVVPVEVYPCGGGCPYRAAAKLRLRANGNYTLMQIYGRNPAVDPAVNVTTSECRNLAIPADDKQRLREIEIDRHGGVYVLGAQRLNDDNWMLMYDDAEGTPSERAIELLVEGPTAFHLSRETDELFLASSINQETITQVYRYEIVRTGGAATDLAPAGTIEIDHGMALHDNRGFGHLATITDIAEDPYDGSLYVLGFTMPRFESELDPNQDSAFNESDGWIFTTPTLAIVGPETRRVRRQPAERVLAREIRCNQLALPLSFAFHPSSCGASADTESDGDVDLADVATFQGCFGTRDVNGLPCQVFDVDCNRDIAFQDYRGLWRKLRGP